MLGVNKQRVRENSRGNEDKSPTKPGKWPTPLIPI